MSVVSKDSDKWYEEACQIVDTVTASLTIHPEIQKSQDFSIYTDVFVRVLRQVAFDKLEEEDILALKEAAVKVLPPPSDN